MNTDLLSTPLIVGLLLGWLTLAIGFFLLRGIRNWWRLNRYGANIDHSSLLSRFCRELANIEDQVALNRLLADEIPQSLGVVRAALLLPEAYNLLEAGGGELKSPVNHAAVRWVASGGEAHLAHKGRLHKIISQGRSDLSWTQVWVPLMRGASLRGLWLLGARQGEMHYSPEDLRWLTDIAREAAAVLESIHHAEHQRQTATEMRTLYRQVVEGRETERGRLARELHDGVLQDLCAVTRDLKALEGHSNGGQENIAALVSLSSETVNAMRAICNDLRPPLLQQDLGAALKALVNELDGRSPAPVHIEINTQEQAFYLGENATLAVFRITQEALHNALQHADASEIAVRLTQYPDRLRLTVADDGCGIKGGVEPARFVAAGHYGLAGMRERAAMIGGKLEVQTAVDYGTVVVFELPL
jgi:signal transduction histidine kinase